jgi:hypothetical protein
MELENDTEIQGKGSNHRSYAALPIQIFKAASGPRRKFEPNFESP